MQIEAENDMRKERIDGARKSDRPDREFYLKHAERDELEPVLDALKTIEDGRPLKYLGIVI